eukprot:m.31159 g.31159  ORF g.31159 m.31159 type:complete len:83 (+) comp41632_c0_seq1:165-413(+)
MVSRQMGHGFIKDPAIERWASMRERTGEFFKWTPRTTRAAVLWGVVVPVVLYEVAVAEYRHREAVSGKNRQFPSLFCSGTKP